MTGVELHFAELYACRSYWISSRQRIRKIQAVRVMVFYLLLFGGIIWFYQNNSTFQEQFNIGIHNAQVLTQSWLYRITGKEVATPAQQTTDQQTENQATPR